MRTLAALMLAFGLALQAAAPVPRPAGDFKAVDASGKQVSLASFKGKVVVVQFLFTSCSHCQAAARMLSKLQSELGPKGLQVIGIAFNAEVNTKNAAADNAELAKFKAHATFPLAIASQEAVMKYLGFSVLDGRWGVPQIVVIDRQGTIQAQTEPQPGPALLEEASLRAKLTKYLAAK